MSGYFYTMPAQVFYDKELSANAKLIACIIANFCDKYGTCTVTNRHLGDVLGKSERSLSRLISELNDAGYIQVKVDILDTTKRTITLTSKMSTHHDKNDVPPRQKCLHNNTIYNNTKYNNNYNVEFDEIIAYLNEKTNSKFKATTEATRKLMSGRLSEGYSVEDFRKVVDAMKKKWEGTDYEQYLTPTTLFAPSNFEKYYNFAIRQTQEEQKPKIKA